MEVWEEFRKTPESHLETIDLESSLEFKTLRTRKKKDAFLETLVALLTLQTGADNSIVQLSMSPLDFAELFGAGVRVQLPFVCGAVGCGEESYHKCEHCGSYGFGVRNSKRWCLTCLNTEHRSFKIPLPINGECECAHPYVLEQSDIESSVRIFFDSDLNEILENVVRKYVRGHSFDSKSEEFYLRGSTFVYQLHTQSHSTGHQPIHIDNVEGDLNMIGSVGKTDKLSQGRGNQISK